MRHKSRRTKSTIVWLVLFTIQSGCRMHEPAVFDHRESPNYFPSATQVEYPDVEHVSTVQNAHMSPRHVDSGDPRPDEFWDLTLEEVIQISLQNSRVLDKAGGRVLDPDQNLRTVIDPAISEANPITGTEAALSSFDTQLSTSLFFNNFDRVFNNQALSGGLREVTQDVDSLDVELRKTTAAGTQFSLRNLTSYQHDNPRPPSNLFANVWETQFEMSVRQPLLQGAGIAFNRIAGPNSTVGAPQGVLLARINTDVSIADFEIAVQDLISDVEDAYWNLYFQYRELHAQIAARNVAHKTWQTIYVRFQVGPAEGEATAAEEAHARDQHFVFVDRVRESTNRMYERERTLRRLMGLSATDDKVIRPADEPSVAQVVFPWDEALAEALASRTELRKQKWQVKRRELELAASRNFAKPRLDAFALYRDRGFGDDLYSSDTSRRFNSAYQDFFSFDHQEWEYGIQFSMPLGMRQALASVRHSELSLARERAILDEQEQTITHDLSNAISQAINSHAALRMTFNRLTAAKQRREATFNQFDQGINPRVDLLLESQERFASAQIAYYQALTDYALSIKNVQQQKGTLLAYNGINLAEGPWSEQAHADACRNLLKWRPRRIDYRMTIPAEISLGNVAATAIPAPQHAPRVSPHAPDVLPHEPPSFELPMPVVTQASFEDSPPLPIHQPWQGSFTDEGYPTNLPEPVSVEMFPDSTPISSPRPLDFFPPPVVDFGPSPAF